MTGAMRRYRDAVRPQGAAIEAAAALAGDAVQVWLLRLDTDAVAVASLEDEVERAERMWDERRRSRFLRSRAWLRLIVGSHLGTDPAAVRFVEGERGKPSIVGGGGLSFSLSRSDDTALVALTRGRAVGVDIERIRPLDHAGIAKRFFAPAEAEALAALPEVARGATFFAMWTRKEAILKATGEGIGNGISHVDVVGLVAAGRGALAPLDVGPHHAAALAVDGAALGPIHLLRPDAGSA